MDHHSFVNEEQTREVRNSHLCHAAMEDRKFVHPGTCGNKTGVPETVAYASRFRDLRTFLRQHKKRADL